MSIFAQTANYALHSIFEDMGIPRVTQISYHPHSGWFEEAPQGGKESIVGSRDVLQEFRITKMFADDERRHAAIPKTVAMIRFWAMISFSLPYP
jgi:hypothetical protein